MRIKSIKSRPVDDSLIPTIAFDLEIEHKKYKSVILGVEGWLLSDDRKKVAVLTEYPQIQNEQKLGAELSIRDSEFQDTIYKTTLLATFDRYALRYIEKRRLSNSKRDVNLILDLRIKVLISLTTIFHTFLASPSQIGIDPNNISKVLPRFIDQKKAYLVIYAYNSNFSSDHINRWVLSGDGMPYFLQFITEKIEHKIRITLSDWVHDFAPTLGLGEYYIIEIPKIPKGNKLQKAWEYIEEAEKSFRKGDFDGVFSKCREVGILLANFMGQFKDRPNIKKWRRVFKNFEYLASLSLHKEDISNKETPQGDIKICYYDVEYLLIRTKAMLKYVTEFVKDLDI